MTHYTNQERRSVRTAQRMWRWYLMRWDRWLLVGLALLLAVAVGAWVDACTQTLGQL